MRLPIVLALLPCLAGFAPPARAALWSIDNTVVRRGDHTTLIASLTGDGVMVGASVDIQVPPGVSVVSTTGRNGGVCNHIAAQQVVRVLWVDYGLRPLPFVETPMCDLRLRVSSPAGALWMNMKESICVRGDVTRFACALDRGYLTIRP